jgi:hypothetical protein
LLKKNPLKQAWSLFLVLIAFSLMLAQPLWAVEETPTSQDKQEESFFQGLKRSLDEWLGRDQSANKTKEEAPKPEEQKPVVKKSGGRKALNSFKKEMNKISDNVSESVERDKKTLKKKLDKYSNKK